MLIRAGRRKKLKHTVENIDRQGFHCPMAMSASNFYKFEIFSTLVLCFKKPFFFLLQSRVGILGSEEGLIASHTWHSGIFHCWREGPLTVCGDVVWRCSGFQHQVMPLLGANNW